MKKWHNNCDCFVGSSFESLTEIHWWIILQLPHHCRCELFLCAFRQWFDCVFSRLGIRLKSFFPPTAWCLENYNVILLFDSFIFPPFEDGMGPLASTQRSSSQSPSCVISMQPSGGLCAIHVITVSCFTVPAMFEYIQSYYCVDCFARSIFFLCIFFPQKMQVL